jgi:hypothetical protein
MPADKSHAEQRAVSKTANKPLPIGIDPNALARRLQYGCTFQFDKVQPASLTREQTKDEFDDIGHQGG